MRLLLQASTMSNFSEFPKPQAEPLQSQEHLPDQSIFDHLSIGYVQTNQKGNVQRANPVAASLFDRPLEEMSTLSLISFLPHSERSVFEIRLEELMRMGLSALPWPVRLCLPAGRRLVATLEGWCPQQSLTAPDSLIWRMEQAETGQDGSILKLQRWLDDLIHEGRNSLQRSQSALERLSWRLGNQKELLTLLTSAQSANDKIAQHFDHACDLIRPVHLTCQPCDLRKLLRQAWEVACAHYPNRQIQWELKPENLSLQCEVDPGRVMQVFAACFEYALELDVDPSPITLTASEVSADQKPALQLVWVDQGPAPEPEERARFFDGEHVTGPRKNSLGMALAKKILEAHSGQMHLGAEQGMSIVLTFPRRKA